MKYQVLTIFLPALLIGCGGGSGGGNGAVSATAHKASECPKLSGKYHLNSDSRVMAEFGKDENGDLVFEMDSSGPIVVNGKAQTGDEGKSTITATCSKGVITVQGSSEGTAMSGIIKEKGEGFVIEMQQPEASTSEYVRGANQNKPEANDTDENESPTDATEFLK